MGFSFQTESTDWWFIVLATLNWISSLLVAVWDSVVLQRGIFRFDAANAIGLIMVFSGVSLRLLSKRTLGRYYSYGLKPPSKLVKHGIYGRARHPIYLAMLRYTAGAPLIFSSAYGCTLAMGLAPLVLYRIRIEERMLTEKFGDEYREYARKTKKLIPFII